ncbi:MAG: CotH kinase family protein, partial [Planctomycetota bacterium]
MQGVNRIVVLTMGLLGPVVWIATAETFANPTDWPCISEFSALNKKGFSTRIDGRETYGDWIEIHNPSQQSLNLDGWYLTDDPTELTHWRFPEIHLEAGGYVIVWASGLQEADHPENWPFVDDTGTYHTNFKLDSDGEYLALINLDLQVVHEYTDYQFKNNQWGYPPQDEGVTYGLCNEQHVYLPIPTPGQSNHSGCKEQSEAVVFSLSGGVFSESVILELSCASADADIYYTLDGSESITGQIDPSKMYTRPIMINESLEVKARVYEPNKLPGPVVSHSYFILSKEVASFSSNLPIVIVDTGLQSINENIYKLVNAMFVDTNDSGLAHATDSADFAGRCGLKIRGSTSTDYPKKQYALETWDLNNDDKNVSILGFPEESDWILYGPYDDGTLMRNYLSYMWSNRIGRYAVRCRFCEMFLNTGQGKISTNDYVGVYVFMEKIKRDANRVDIDSVDLAYTDAPDSFILKADRRDPGDSGFYTSRGTPHANWVAFNYVYPKEDKMTTAQRNAIKGYLEEFEDALYGPDFADPNLGYAKYIDVDSLIDHHILNEFTKNSDGLWLSTFIYKDTGGKLHMGPIWDLNFSLGGDDGWEGWNPIGWHGDAIGSNYWWWPRLFEDPSFRQKWIDRWYQLHKDLLSTDRLLMDIDDTAALLWETQQRNFERWPGVLGSYVWRNARGWEQRDTFQKEVDYMKDWLTTRLDWLKLRHPMPSGGDIHPQAPKFNLDGGDVPAGYEVTLSAPVGTIYYTLDGSDPSTFSVSSNESIPLVAEDAPKRVLVPTAPVSDSWREGSEPFDDTDWALVSGYPGGVGYENSSGYETYIGLDVGPQMYGISGSCYI